MLLIIFFLCFTPLAESVLIQHCDANETWTYGVTEAARCEFTCYDREPECEKVDEWACTCIPGYVRIGMNCYLPEDCVNEGKILIGRLESSDCNPNEEVVPLGYPYACRTKCASKNIIREKRCVLPMFEHVCSCKEGYLFDENDNECRPIDECEDDFGPPKEPEEHQIHH